jgi:uncharacterized protein
MDAKNNPHMSSSLVILVTLVFVLAGMVKGVTGLGLPTVAIAILSLFLPVGAAASLLVVPSLATNVWQFVRSPKIYRLVGRLSGMLMGVAIGAAFSPFPGVSSGGSQAPFIAGAALVAYGLIGLSGWRVPSPGRHEIWAGPLAGVATGLVTVSSGVFVVPSVPYLQAIGLTKEELVGALGLTFSICTVCLWLSLEKAAPGATPSYLWSSLMLLPALLGLQLGTVLRKNLSEAGFKRVFLVSLVVLGTYMCIHTLIKAGI